MSTSLGVAARAEKIDLRQPAAHALARLAAAMAAPAPEDVQATKDEGGSVEELEQAMAAAVPPSVPELLAALLADKVMEVRISALHAVKTLCKARPALLRAGECKIACGLAPGIVAACNERTKMQVTSAAMRTLMHLCGVCGWTDGAPPPVLHRAHIESANYVAEFTKRTYKGCAASRARPSTATRT